MKSSRSYNVQELAQMSGVSARTLHYYDEMGLLVPQRKDNNYRSYEEAEVDRLQQILLYREIGVSLADIKRILDDPEFNERDALQMHLANLKSQQMRIMQLIESVEKTLGSKEGNEQMSDAEKFEGFKRQLVEENEKKYGDEIREKYGDEEIDASNANFMGLTEEQYNHMQEMSNEILTLLSQGMDENNPAGEAAQKACDLQRQILELTWKKGSYCKEAHRNLGDMYVCDERFKAYYDESRPGRAEFLREALNVYCA